MEWYISRDIAGLVARVRLNILFVVYIVLKWLCVCCVQTTEMVSEEPPIFRLKFKPRGMGKVGHPYYVSPKENRYIIFVVVWVYNYKQFFFLFVQIIIIFGFQKCIRCVICGNTEQLCKHSIVPHCYRAHLPDRYQKCTLHYNCIFFVLNINFFQVSRPGHLTTSN